MRKFFELDDKEKSRADDLNKRFIFINACDSTFIPDFNEKYFPKLLASKFGGITGPFAGQFTVTGFIGLVCRFDCFLVGRAFIAHGLISSGELASSLRT